VMRRSILCIDLKNEEAMARVRPQSHRTKKSINIPTTSSHADSPYVKFPKSTETDLQLQ